MRYKILLTAFAALPSIVYAQDVSLPETPVLEELVVEEADSIEGPDFSQMSVCDSLFYVYQPGKMLASTKPLPQILFMPAVYHTYIMPEGQKVSPFAPDYSGSEAMKWIEDEVATDRRARDIFQRFAISSPETVKYNYDMLPEAPKQFVAEVNPQSHTIEIHELVPVSATPTLESEEVKKIHWINTFNGSLQFSQAYVSPNWYQGGNNNLNMLLNLYYNIKLNQQFHPNLLFETTVQYKLGMNSAPDDTIRNYNISADIFQVNSTFGLKAAHNWYYTVNMQFKTQLLNSYKSNTNNMTSALLSPGELNFGLGMTYNTENKKKTMKFDLSISPLSYNMMICTNSHMNEESYGIKKGHTTVSKIGSSLESKLMLKLAYNITLNSRFFGFTDYDRAYCDFENTLVFEINKYLTTQLFLHLRYDTDAHSTDPDWRKLQIKEILSLGFAYKFTTH